MPRFVGKPVVIEAHQYLGDPLPQSFALAVARHRQDGGVDVSTNDGLRHCRITDWVWRDWNGSFHVAKDALFEAMFEEQRPQPPMEFERIKRSYNRKDQVNA
jgi:hypothetical protein